MEGEKIMDDDILMGKDYYAYSTGGVTEMITVKGFDDDEIEPVEIITKDEQLERMWSMGLYYITLEQIEELKKGKCIYTEESGHAHIIYLKGE